MFFITLRLCLHIFIYLRPKTKPIIRIQLDNYGADSLQRIVLLFYFLSFHQTTTHDTVIDVLHTLESTSCFELEAKTKIQILHLKLH